MAQKFNWGAALMSAGQSLDEYAERKRREMMAKALRDQALEDDQRKREQEIADRDALWARQDALAEQQYGRIVPPSFNLPLGQETTGGFGGMRFKPATELALDMYPRARQSTRAPVPPPEQFVLIGTDGQQQIYNAPAGKIPSAVASLETADYSPLPAGMDESGRSVFRLVRNYERPVSSGGGSGPVVPKPLDLTRSADALTEGALGPAVEKTTAAGNVYDFSMGGTRAAGPDLQALAVPEVRRAFWEAARDSAATGRWPVDSPSEVLSGKIWETVSPQYAEVALPSGWVFDPGKPNTAADDLFVNDRVWWKGDDEKKPLDFFREFIVPEVNKARDEKLGWQALVNSAGQYGLDPNDLLPMLDKRKFAWLFKQAESANVDDKISKKFGDAGSAR